MTRDVTGKRMVKWGCRDSQEEVMTRDIYRYCQRKIIELAEELPLPEGMQVEVSIRWAPTTDTARVTLECAGMLSDLTERQRNAFEEALARRPRFSRRLSL